MFIENEAGRRRNAPSRGFTLVESLVAVAIVLGVTGLLTGWIWSARRNQKVRATEAAMGNLLLVVDTVKNASPIFPDHRLANFFYVQPHTAAAGVQPTWEGINCRRMSSGEFLAFLATLVPSSNTMVGALGTDFLPASPVPGAWGLAQDDAGALVDVFEQDPGNANALDKDAASASFSLVSPNAGWRLRAPVDAWGNALVYRLYTHRDDLNRADTDTAPLATGGTYRIREDILQDEQATRDRYVAAGVPVDNPTATAATAEYVRPAVASYAHPQWISPGPDGKWGRFHDGTPPLRDARTDGRTARTDASPGDQDALDNVYSQEKGR